MRSAIIIILYYINLLVVLSVLVVLVLRLNQGCLCLQMVHELPDGRGSQEVLSLHLYLWGQVVPMLRSNPTKTENCNLSNDCATAYTKFKIYTC